MTADIRQARTAFLRVGLLVPLLILAVACLVAASWMPDLPDPVATHWGEGGGPDGFGPAWTYLAILAGLGGGLVLVFAALGWFAHRLPASPTAPRLQWSPTARLLAATNLALAGMLSITVFASLAPQRGLVDATQAPDVSGGVILALVAMPVLGLAGWLLQPKIEASREASADDAAPLPLATGERAAWFGTAVMGKAGAAFLLVALVGMAGLSVALLAGGQSGGWTTALTTVVVAVLVISTSVFRVRISEQGLRVRSLVGFPTFTVPASEVRAARVTEVNPMAEFGGWGIRKGLDGRSGVVLRAGKALEVARTDGRVFVVTVDDAETAAAVLAAAAPGDHGSAPTQGDR